MTSRLRSLRPAAFFIALLAALTCTPAITQTSTGAQQLAFAGLRSVAQQGQFNAIKADASGNLFLLLDQKDGVRILKTDPTATNLLAQSHLGSSGDIGLSLALDPSGNVYVAGTTTSTTLTGTAGAAFPTRAGTSTNSFIAKYDPNLTNLFVTFAGSGRLAATSVAATADAVFLTGSLFAATLPVTPNALQLTPAQGSSQNGFVERFSTTGTTLVYATYLTGANGDTSPAALVADSTDSAYIAGYTTATGFPTLAALDPIIQAAAANTTPTSGFLTKLTPAGDAITFSTFIPGSGVSSLALDTAQNNLLLSGTIDFSAFPVANVQSPLVATQYQSALRIALNGSSVISSTLLAPGTQSFVTPGLNGTAWTNGNLTTPLLPLTPVTNTGTSFAARNYRLRPDRSNRPLRRPRQHQPRQRQRPCHPYLPCHRPHRPALPRRSLHSHRKLQPPRHPTLRSPRRQRLLRHPPPPPSRAPPFPLTPAREASAPAPPPT